jgi:beige protein homolog 1
MANRLKRFWDIPTLWPICFSVLFGYDVAEIDFEQDFNLTGLVGIFGQKKVVYPESLQIVTSMLHHGLNDVLRHQTDPDSPATTLSVADDGTKTASPQERRPRARSMDLVTALQTRRK